MLWFVTGLVAPGFGVALLLGVDLGVGVNFGVGFGVAAGGSGRGGSGGRCCQLASPHTPSKLTTAAGFHHDERSISSSCQLLLLNVVNRF